jgi:hypothetical protein
LNVVSVGVSPESLPAGKGATLSPSPELLLLPVELGVLSRTIRGLSVKLSSNFELSLVLC